MVKLIASIIGGIELGGTFALISLGIVLAFRATKVFNFAQGQLLLLPAFILGYSEVHNVPLSISIPLAFIVNILVSVSFYFLVLNRTTNLPLFMGIIATLGLAAILDGAMGILFQVGQYQINIPGVPKGFVLIYGAGISKAEIFFAIFTLVIAIIFAAVIRYTHIGLSLTAAGQNALLSSQCGLQVRRLHAISWGLAATLAAIAGISYGTSTIANTSMAGLGLDALPAIMLGGLDSIEGAIFGGLVVGLIESFTASYLGGPYINLVTYSLLLVLLMLRPQGIFGTKEVVRA